MRAAFTRRKVIKMLINTR